MTQAQIYELMNQNKSNKTYWTIKQLADILKINTGTLSHSLNQLHKYNEVERRISILESRRYIYWLSEKKED